MNIKARLQHFLCPLHIYCRLRDLGLSKKTARCLSTLYEVNILQPFIHPLIKSK